ncbi:transmembrane protein, putative (macronuclear) [Tetrahymena thermophila SB210]|uniref:Transmembrane protein, putative n=1 Tax=Tetrahymena thermophila (strain SB210) TaxID=312017 RepID=Q22W32_TETTS|nr:transmembrane protein, putative [Tetrahymena thermophila SB210]7W5Z_X Chain X, Transmembrane protein, putative [Tetrahymena thermophila]7W5Z_x Chain x, Transmembrane protein, putative [Tetrahymena thermophila]8GYM_X Chain X, Transmembrane protein, putative [Tetrahymena thermophila SB210]8GYM_x Chain x, Transmembrane protein, putative [Tetrahymena thermophila SB210]8GZU_23 Chain 23, Transmembrane protein, putative [Tetrahymena thermophila SB210]8GZU_78 Chain 78, Transmembrane protein, putat|eukprot:XP_001009830.2 transmembrane protein, putative [Tetrahymena thermophila SB210]
MEPFGTDERNWTHEEKDIITRFLKYDKHVNLKTAEMVYSAEVESAYFGKAGALAGGVISALFFNFPIVRNLPIIRRSVIGVLPFLYCYTWGKNTQEELRWLKTFAAYQRFVVYHGQHCKLWV